MDWLKIKHAVREAYPDSDRAKNIARLINRHTRRRAKERKLERMSHLLDDMKIKAYALLPNLNLLTDALAGKKIVALDAEWSPYRDITEIGVTVMQGDDIVAHNVRVVPGGYGFLYGTTRYMTDDQARAWFLETISDADLLIGHAIKNDRVQFRKWGAEIPDLPFIDTASWSKIIFPPHAISLGKLAIHYGVDHRGAHCGGNDSYMTLMVALRMHATMLEQIYEAV